MKLNVVPIVRAHWKTLYDAESNNTKYTDFAVFYGIPAAASAFAYLLDFRVDTDVHSVSITVFGIFVALLLNIQVAIFSIFQRRWDTPADERQAQMQLAKLTVRRKLLAELNTNISYLTVISCAALVAFLVFFIAELCEGVAPALAVALYSHFLLTFMMVAKRSYALFQSEYESNFC